MNRRDFLTKASVLGIGATAPTLFGVPGIISRAAAMPMVDQVDFVMPQVMPQVINVFLYGGPSELAGNLTNMDIINRNSQNPYPNALRRAISDDEGQVTQHGFWADAGGRAMEDMLGAGDMSIYRTINRRKNNTRAHRPSVFSSLKGSLAIDAAPGMGSTLATLLNAHRDQLDGSALLGGKQLTELVLPFISFEGSTTAFARDVNGNLPLQLRGLSLDEEFDNPYSRDNNENDLELEVLVRKIVNNAQRIRFDKVADGFDIRRNMDQLVGNLQNAANDPLPAPPAADAANDPDVDPGTGSLRYPGNNSFSGRIRAAVTLAIKNPDSLFITVGGGLGGWDDHSSAIEDYVPRMNQIMEALRVATRHIKYSDARFGGNRSTNNIIIKVHGDFGRNVNLNNSAGWDHGNNQNLYTLGGSALRPAGALGKIVGRTEVFGPANENRQFTRPTDDSYEAEPLAIASTVYKYFGAQNPQALTRDNDMNPDGDAAINEAVRPEPPISL